MKGTETQLNVFLSKNMKNKRNVKIIT